MMAGKVPFVTSPEGQTLPFVADKLHSVAGEKVPQRMLYPSPELLAEAIDSVPVGSVSDLVAIRGALAVSHGAESTCPVTTQRVMQQIAEAAVAAWQAGDKNVTPFWRVVDPDRPFARRMAGGPDRIRERLAADR